MFVIFFFKQKTAYEMRISDWSSDVCSSDLQPVVIGTTIATDKGILTITGLNEGQIDYTYELTTNTTGDDVTDSFVVTVTDVDGDTATDTLTITILDDVPTATNDTDSVGEDGPLVADGNVITGRSEEHTSELQSLMRISYAVFCLKKKKKTSTGQH